MKFFMFFKLFFFQFYNYFKLYSYNLNDTNVCYILYTKQTNKVKSTAVSFDSLICKSLVATE